MKKADLATIDLSRRWDSEEHYQDRLKELQNEIRDLQSACFHNSHRAVIVLEGWDASGKGGAIRRMTEKLDPRSCHVYATGKPDERERNEHYLQRFWQKLPPRGHIAIFDRSWYGRVLVERIEGFATRDQWHRAYDEINDFERTLADDGVVLVKLMMHISQDEQLKRYCERLDNPKKHWKLTDEDLRNRSKSREYANAYEDMLERTHCKQAPWFVIPGEHKWFARTSVIETVCSVLRKSIDTRIPRYTSDEIAQTRKLLGLRD